MKLGTETGSLINVEVGDLLKRSTTRLGDWPLFKVGDAPKGGRAVMGGDNVPEPFCFITSMPLCIDNYGGSSRDFAVAREVKVGDILVITGLVSKDNNYHERTSDTSYGAHEVLGTRNGNLTLYRIRDGFVSSDYLTPESQKRVAVLDKKYGHSSNRNYLRQTHYISESEMCG